MIKVKCDKLDCLNNNQGYCKEDEIELSSTNYFEMECYSWETEEHNKHIQKLKDKLNS